MFRVVIKFQYVSILLYLLFMETRKGNTMFKKILLYSLAALGIISLLGFVYIGLFYETEPEADLEGVYYTEEESHNRKYHPGEVVVNQGVIFALDEANRFLILGEEKTIDNYGKKLEIRYRVNNKVDTKAFEELTVSPFQFRLFTADGKELRQVDEDKSTFTSVKVGETGEGVVHFKVRDEDEYFLEFSSEAYLAEPHKITYRIQMN